MTSDATRCMRRLAAILLISGAIAARTAAALTSGFDAGTEGWKAANLRISPFYTNPPGVLALDDPVWTAAGGNPDGTIAWTDVDENYFTFSAPAAFLGDHHDAYGGSLSFDMKVTESDGVPQPGVILVGASQTLLFDLASPGSDWTHLSVSLVETGWYDSDGNSPSAQQMRDALGSLQAIYLTGDWFTGTETANLDNVSLVAPEPSSALLLGFVGAFAARRRRRG